MSLTLFLFVLFFVGRLGGEEYSDVVVMVGEEGERERLLEVVVGLSSPGWLLVLLLLLFFFFLLLLVLFL